MNRNDTPPPQQRLSGMLMRMCTGLGMVVVGELPFRRRFGCRGASVVSPVYIAEISPARLRGRLVAVTQLNIVLGILLAYLSNYIIGSRHLGEIEGKFQASPWSRFNTSSASIKRRQLTTCGTATLGCAAKPSKPCSAFTRPWHRSLCCLNGDAAVAKQNEGGDAEKDHGSRFGNRADAGRYDRLTAGHRWSAHRAVSREQQGQV